MQLNIAKNAGNECESDVLFITLQWIYFVSLMSQISAAVEF